MTAPAVSADQFNAGTVSVAAVVPVYSGQRYLENLVAEFDKLRTGWVGAKAPMHLAEVVFVDDACIDQSAEVLARLAEKHTWVRIVTLSRNYGQHPATVAGILHTSSDWVVTLDEDLQHPPTRINDLLREAALGARDVVYAQAEDKVHENLFRDFSSIIWKRTLSKLTGNPNVRYFNSFRLMRGSIARAVGSVCGHETYFDVALFWFTQRFGVVRMRLKDDRVISGAKSSYNISKLFSHARRMLMSSQAKVIRLGGLIGLLALIASIFYGTYVVARALLTDEVFVVRGWTSLMVITVFFGGIITFLVGVCIEYLAQLVLQAQGKPLFFTVDRRSDAELVRYFSERPE